MERAGNFFFYKSNIDLEAARIRAIPKFSRIRVTVDSKVSEEGYLNWRAICVCVCARGDQAGANYIKKSKCVIISNSNQVLAIGKKWN